MRKLCPEHLVPSHTRPLSGQAEIQKQLTCYRDAIQFVHDQTLRLMNRNMHPVEIGKAIKLPPSLRDNPFLQPFSCLPEWASRVVFDSYIGWFSGNPEELFPFTLTERGQRMVKAFGAKKILQQAEATLKDDLQWALELSSHVFLSDPTNENAKDIRKQALLALAEQQTSVFSRNFLLTYILEDHGIAPKRYPTAKIIFDMPLEIVLKRLAWCIKAEEVEGVTMTVLMKFECHPDKAYTLYLRNCILEVTEEKNSTHDISVRLETVNSLKLIMVHQKTPQQMFEDKMVETDKPEEMIKFFNYFESGDPC